MMIEIRMTARLYSDFRRKVAHAQNRDVLSLLGRADVSGGCGSAPALIRWLNMPRWDPRADSGVAKIVNFLKEADENERSLKIDGRTASAWLPPKQKKRFDPKDMLRPPFRFR